MLKIYEDSSNYTATVVKIKDIHPIEGMDRIALTNIQGSPIVISKDTEEGSIGLFFPAECTISPEFLSKNNLFKRSEMNADQTQKGYFETSGRVKALKLVKGTVISTGFYCPLTSLSYACDISKLNVGDTFNEVNGVFICKKYIPKAIQNAIARSKNDKLASKFKKLIPDQFRLHEDTSKLAMNLHRLMPSDIIAITSKWHGCVSADTEVETLEFGTKTIKDVVENKLDCHIKSFDIDNSEIVFAKVEQHFFKPDDGEWYEVELENGQKLEITGNNPVWLPKLSVYRRAEDLEVGDVLSVV